MEVSLFWMVNTFCLRSYVYKFSNSKCENVSEEEKVFLLENYDISPFLPVLNDVITLALQASFFCLISKPEHMIWSMLSYPE